MNNKLILQTSIGFIAFGIWTYLAYSDPTMRGAYSVFVISVVTTLSALILRDMPTEQKPADPVPSKKPPQEPLP